MFKRFGHHLAQARRDRGFTQTQLATRCKLSQPQIALLETSKRRPTPEQLTKLAEALDVSLQRFLTGSETPGTEIDDLVIELRAFGAVDLCLSNPTVPGAFRPLEQVVSLIVKRRKPDPRVLEVIPALLSWNHWDVRLLKAHALNRGRRTLSRLAWLADIALTIDRMRGFPGGCAAWEELDRLVAGVRQPKTVDDLGWPASPEAEFPPAWKRWRITYDGDLRCFEDRAKSLHQEGRRRTTKRGGAD